jgi:hypothetical protein
LDGSLNTAGNKYPSERVGICMEIRVDFYKYRANFDFSKKSFFHLVAVCRVGFGSE